MHRFRTIPACDGRTDRHVAVAKTALAERRAGRVKTDRTLVIRVFTADVAQTEHN